MCPEGTYSGQGSVECIKCPEEMHCPKGSSHPLLCPIEDPDCRLTKVPSQPVGSDKRQLQSCSLGAYYDGGTCLTCPEGYRCSGGANNPVRCTGNTYSSTGQSGCSVSFLLLLFLFDLYLTIKYLNIFITLCYYISTDFM